MMDGEMLKPWPFCGYAPGHYTITCLHCEQMIHLVDKRATSCLPCAVIAANTALATRPAPPTDVVGVEAIWQRACEGREGYCSSDLQDAAKWAIGEAFRMAEAAARSATLPEGYQWSEGNREKFDFGRDSAADAIAALSAQQEGR